MTRTAKLIAAGVVAVAAFVWAFKDVDVPALAAALRTAHPSWIGAAVLSVALTMSLVVLRWWFLLGRPTIGVPSRAPWAVLTSSTLAAQMANIVMPFRLGDGVRIVAASHTLGLGPARAASSAVLERLADVIALGAVTAVLTLSGTAPEWARSAMLQRSWLAAAIVGAAAAAVAAAIWFGARRVSFVPAASALALAAATSIAVPAASALTNWLVFRAFDLPVPASASLLLMVVLQVGTSIVTVPGGLGVSQLLTVKTLEIWHVAPADALAFSLVLYAVANVPKLLSLPIAMAVAGRSPVRMEA